MKKSPKLRKRTKRTKRTKRINRTKREINRTKREINRTKKKINRTKKKINRTKKKINRTKKKIYKKKQRGGMEGKKLASLPRSMTSFGRQDEGGVGSDGGGGNRGSPGKGSGASRGPREIAASGGLSLGFGSSGSSTVSSTGDEGKRVSPVAGPREIAAGGGLSSYGSSTGDEGGASAKFPGGTPLQTIQERYGGSASEPSEKEQKYFKIRRDPDWDKEDTRVTMTKEDYETQQLEDDSFIRYMAGRIEDLTEEEMSQLPWQGDAEPRMMTSAPQGDEGYSDARPYKKSRGIAPDSGA